MQNEILAKFSTSGKEALARAQEMANRAGKNEIEPEFILAALSQQKNGLAGGILRRAGIQMEIIKKVFRETNAISLMNSEMIFGRNLKTSANKKNGQETRQKECGQETNNSNDNRLPSDMISDWMRAPETIEEMQQEIVNLIRDPFYQVTSRTMIMIEREETATKKLEQALKSAEIKLGKTARKVIERAVNAAAKTGNTYVGSEHLLLGILETEDVTVLKIFELGQVDVERLKNQLQVILSSTAKFSELTQPTRQKNSSQQSTTRTADRETSETPALDVFATNLTTFRAQQNVDPVIGRGAEIQRLTNILARRTKNNPVLIGEPGVGKTAIVEGLAKKIAAGEVPDALGDKKIYNLDLGLLVAGTTFRGDFENRLKHVMDEVKRNPNIILFVDEIHNIIGAGSASGTMDAANLLKPALSRGEIRCIGATTPQEYKKFIEPDPALERRFQPIYVKESTKEEAVELLRGIAKNYEKFHRVEITSEAIEAAVYLSERYIQDKFLPDKAIDLIDEAAGSKKVREGNTGLAKEIRDLKWQISEIMIAKEEGVQAEKFDEALKLKDEEDRLMNKLLVLRQRQTEGGEKILGKIEASDIEEIIARITNIPREQIAWQGAATPAKSGAEARISQKIIGQEEVIKEVTAVIRKHLTGLADPRRPLGSFIFLGPSGVGKTELTKVMAKEFFQNEEGLVRLDMTEFSEAFSISKLIGAPAGYVGFRESGKLTEAIKNQPYSIVLFDEIEKAHREVRNLLLQIMEDGKLTDATGREVNFKNTIIVMTSNIGVKELNKTQEIGFEMGAGSEVNYERVKARVLEELKREFSPEFLNRIDKTLVFKPLNKKDLEKIVQLQIEELAGRIENKKMKLEITDKAKRYLAKLSFNPDSGAREVRKNISNLIEEPLADALISNKFGAGDAIRAELKGEKIMLLK